MKNDLIKTVTPEEKELAQKRADLDELSQVLAERELDLEELKLSVARFQHRYFSEVGRKYVELDDLRAQVAELKAKRNPGDSTLKRDAETAREEAKKSAEEYQDGTDSPEPTSGKTEASEETKKLYRRIASIIHPDKATDEKSRQLRTRLMAELNEAYARKDVARMQAILAAWDESPDAVPGEGTGAELVRAIRTIAQIKRRISEIQNEISKVMASEIHVLMTRVHEADLAGQNLIAEMAKSLESEIQKARAELALRQP